MSDPLLAVVGTGRNGSTMLARLLDGSPGIWMHPVEVNYLCVWDDLARTGRPQGLTLQNAATHPLTALDRPLATPVLLRFYEAHWREIEELYAPRLTEPLERAGDPAEALAARPEWTADAFLPAFLAATRRAYGRPDAPATTAFKTLEVQYVEDYARVFPSLRFLHIVRNPLDTFSSIKRSRNYSKPQTFYYAGHDMLLAFIEARWVPHVRTALDLSRAEPERHLLVRYEDVRARPADELRRVCDWLGVPTPSHPDRLTVLGGRPMREMPANPSQPGVAQPDRVVADMETRFRYDEVMARRERDLIVRATAPLAGELGYELVNGATCPSRIGLWLRWLPPDASELRHVRSKARWLLEMTRRRIAITRRLASPRS